VKRLYKAYRENGARGLVSKQRGQAGNHRSKTETGGKVLELTPQVPDSCSGRGAKPQKSRERGVAGVPVHVESGC